MTDLFSYLPDYYDDNVTMKELQDIISIYVDSIKASLKKKVNDAHVQSALDIDRWEKIYGIVPEEEMTEEQRKEIISSRMIGYGTTTLDIIQNITYQFTDAHVTIEEDNQNYTINIYFDGTIGIPDYVDKLYQAISDIIPAHIRPVYIFFYNTHSSLIGFTHNKLAELTHEQIHSSDLED